MVAWLTYMLAVLPVLATAMTLPDIYAVSVDFNGGTGAIYGVM